MCAVTVHFKPCQLPGTATCTTVKDSLMSYIIGVGIGGGGEIKLCVLFMFFSNPSRNKHLHIFESVAQKGRQSHGVRNRGRGRQGGG